MGYKSSTRPAILLNAYKAFSSTITTKSTATPVLATLQSTKSTSSLALLRYIKLVAIAIASQSPKTPSYLQDKTSKTKGVSTSKRTISDSEDELQQTLPNTSISNNNSVETLSNVYNAPSFKNGVLGAGSLDNEVNVAKNTRPTS